MSQPQPPRPAGTDTAASFRGTSRRGVRNHGRVYSSCVGRTPVAGKGLALVEYLAAKFRHSSAAEWKAHVHTSRVEVNGVVCTDEDCLVKRGDRVTFNRPPWTEPFFHSDGQLPPYLRVCYEDDDIVAIYKPSGLPVMPSTMFYECTVMAILRRQFPNCCDGAAAETATATEAAAVVDSNTDASHHATSNTDSRSDKNGGARGAQSLFKPPKRNANGLRKADSTDTATTPTPAHRLGVGTSGLLLCGKTTTGRRLLGGLFDCSGLDGGPTTLKPKTRARILRQARARVKGVRKTYLALCAGIIESTEEIQVDQPIGPVPYLGALSLHAATDSGRPARSFVQVLHRNRRDSQTLVQVRIVTGRPHQIRIHMAWLGHPLVGDPLYSAGGVPGKVAIDSKDAAGENPPENAALPTDCGYHLHAWKVEFDYQRVEGGKLCLEALPIPKILDVKSYESSLRD